jgi:hypothetical protein
MARWKLTESHYLNVLDCFWEQVETDRETGRQRRKQYPVPMYLNPNSPTDWNYRPGNGHITQGGNSFDEGTIVVCWEGKGERRDIVFVGNPTPGMEPLDDEAREVSSTFTWAHPVDDLSPTFSEAKLSEAAEQFGAAAAEAMTNVHTNELMSMQKQMMDMMAQQTTIMGMLAKAIGEGRRA